jgi:hypothetical protein
MEKEAEMNINNRLKKLESGITNSFVCMCDLCVWFQRVTLGEPREPVSMPDNCQICGKPMGENAARIIVPAKLLPEQWTKLWKGNNT